MWLLRRQLRSASHNVLLVPRYKLSGLGRLAFRVAGPVFWNFLADCLRHPALELASFKRLLKTFLFARCYRHNVSMYQALHKSTIYLQYLLNNFWGSR